MALARVRTIVQNPARKRRLSAKQIKAGFGGKRRQNAARHKRARPKARQINAAPRRKPAARRARPQARRSRRQNPGEIISLVLGNPGRKKGAMAKTKVRRKRAGARRHNNAGTRRRTTRRNPSMKRHTRHHRNPGTSGMGGLVKTSVAVIGGAVGSKLGAQIALGANNTGVFGYLGNAVSGGLLAWGAKAFFKDKAISHGIIVGTVVQIILRVIGDQTAFGSYLSLSGLGDYMASNFAAPQRLVDGLNNPMVEVPQGWGPGAMPLLTQGAAAGVSGLYSGGEPGAGNLY